MNFIEIIFYTVISYIIYYIQIDIHEFGHYIAARIASLNVAEIYLSFMNILFYEKSFNKKYQFHLPYKEIGGTLKTFTRKSISNKFEFENYKRKLLITLYGGPLMSLSITFCLYFCIVNSKLIIWKISFIISLLILLSSLMGDVLNIFSMKKNLTFFAQMAIMQELMLPKYLINNNNLEYLSKTMANRINSLIKNNPNSIIKKYNIAILFLSSLVLKKQILQDNTINYLKKVMFTNTHNCDTSKKHKNQNLLVYFILYLNLIEKDMTFNDDFMEFLDPCLLKRTEINMIEKYIFSKNISDEKFFENCENELSSEKYLYKAIWNTYK
ncbi:site-2 protease family protein [Proteiniborus sp.]|uniref:site-2 protease family protein n=1 Tax=Proteiniborus sp. TaxID=2079015 RepID=UPI00332B0920